MKKHLKLKNKLIKVFFICLIIGSLLSLLFYFSLDKKEINSIISAVKDNKILFSVTNNTTNHLKILSVAILLSYFFIGLPLYIGLIISEGFKITLRIVILLKIYKFKGIIYAILYTIINNGIYLVLLTFIFKKIIKITRMLYKNKFKKEVLNYNLLYNYFISAISLVIIIFISDLIIYLYGNSLLNIIIKICKI